MVMITKPPIDGTTALSMPLRASSGRRPPPQLPKGNAGCVGVWELWCVACSYGRQISTPPTFDGAFSYASC